MITTKTVSVLFLTSLLGVAVAADDATDWNAVKRFWSFQRPRRSALPEVARETWPLRRHDHHVLAKLEESGLDPNPPADPRALIRRVTYDLIGLPPASADVERFVADSSSRAYEIVVDRLLDSPRYGERWARMWLDLARYAEDQAHIVGNNKSLFYPNAYRYRDWVIDALNRDLPYDEFVRQQLAADLVAPEERASHVALGFLGLGPKYYGRGSIAVKADEWEDRVDTVTRGLLGLTAACARCHDHKFDPIETEDYYALAGVFASTRMFNLPLDDSKPKKGKDAKNPEDAVHIVRDADSPQDLNVFVRGDVKSKGPLVRRRFLRVLCSDEPRPFQKGSGRLELAEAIVSRDNPLTARVIVNRVWAELFGRGIVGTTSNFGQLGERPTHPELLDDLAVRFMDAGWSLKWLVREIVLSSSYRQSSDVEASKRRVDPDNRLLWRVPRRRLSVEAWRDTLLSIAGRLDANVGGESIDIGDPKARRRTIYSRVSRFELDPLLSMFDFPDPNVHSAGRSETTTPLQKMFILNNPFMIALAAEISARANREKRVKTVVDRVRFVYDLVLGRDPSDEELAIGVTYMSSEAGASGRDESLWRDYTQMLLASNELLFLD